MKKKIIRKLALNRETMHSLDGVRNAVVGGRSIAVCTTIGGTTRTEDTYDTCGPSAVCSGGCATGGACTVSCPDWP